MIVPNTDRVPLGLSTISTGRACCGQSMCAAVLTSQNPPGALALLPRVRRHPVPVGVAVDRQHHVGVPQQQVADGRPEHPPAAGPLLMRPIVWWENRTNSRSWFSAADHAPRLVEVVPSPGRQLRGQPVELRPVERALGAARRVDRVQDEGADKYGVGSKR